MILLLILLMAGTVEAGELKKSLPDVVDTGGSVWIVGKWTDEKTIRRASNTSREMGRFKRRVNLIATSACKRR